MFQRQSPVNFNTKPIECEERDGWSVVLEYENESSDQFLCDLSHHVRWDIQDSDLSAFRPSGTKIPKKPGESILEGSVLLNRMNRSQASIWHLGKVNPELPEESVYTDTSDCSVHVAIFGPHTYAIAEKLSALDFAIPGQKTPYLFQGPFSHVSALLAAFYILERSFYCLLI